MLWPLVLPFKITCTLLSAMILLAVALAPKVKWKRGRMFGLSIVVASLLFIPSCAGIMTILDTQRFGVFHHATFDDVNDEHVEPWLPTAATDIRLHKSMQGFQAKYSISQADLVNYMNATWTKWGKHSVNSEDKATMGTPGSPYQPDGDEAPAVDPRLTNPLVYESPRAANGAGFTIWYSVEDGIAYQEAGYW